MLRRSQRFLHFATTSPSSCDSTPSSQENLYRIQHLPRPVQLEAAYYVAGNTVDSLDEVRKAGCNHVILVAHGLLGSSRNWNGTVRKIGWKLPKSCAIAALDLRNHGNSPHDAVHSMDAMAADMELFAKNVARELGDEQFAGMGIVAHSMGGATTVDALSMNALDPEALPTLSKYLRAALIVDICPDCRPISAFGSIEAAMEGMKAIDFSKHLTFTEAEKEMRKHVADPALRSFLLTNFVPESPTEPFPRWRCNFPVLYEETMSMRLFSQCSPILHDCTKQKIKVPTFFVFGEDSPYNDPEGRRRIPLLFENSKQTALPGAGHYVHTQKQDEFSKICAEWFQETLCKY